MTNQKGAQFITRTNKARRSTALLFPSFITHFLVLQAGYKESEIWRARNFSISDSNLASQYRENSVLTATVLEIWGEEQRPTWKSVVRKCTRQSVARMLTRRRRRESETDKAQSDG
ncbi:hypothetical protein T09_11193 [Trichinella sp. T9]|nr:hypothetical protein T09_11193 [Trichinella sp. T9]